MLAYNFFPDLLASSHFKGEFLGEVLDVKKEQRFSTFAHGQAKATAPPQSNDITRPRSLCCYFPPTCPGDGATRSHRLCPLIFPFNTGHVRKHGTQHVQVGFYMVSSLDTRCVLGCFLLPDEVNMVIYVLLSPL